MRRVSMVGNSGSGKSTLGRAIAQRLSAPYVELDAIFHQPNWTELPTDDFRDRVADLAAGDTWVIDGNYTAVRDLVWSRADTVVFLDPPRHRVMRQLARRTLGRMIRRDELWNGNREQLRHFVGRDPDKNLLLWAWTNHAKYRTRYLTPDPAYPDLKILRLQTRAEAADLLHRVGTA